MGWKGRRVLMVYVSSDDRGVAEGGKMIVMGWLNKKY
jgi:hypothetical protein